MTGQWRGPEYNGEFPTLGYQVADLIHSSCVIPDGPHMGEPFILTDEQLRTLLHHYRIDPETGRFTYFRGTQLVRPQKWGKGPLSAALICAEAHPQGPVVFDGWDANGEPVGRPFATPHIQVTAVSIDQTDNIFRALLPMIELGPLADVFPDTGLGRVNLPTGGLIEPVTAAARSRLGQRITLSVQDQTESWVESNGGHALADNQRRGLAGMKGRWFSTPNAWNPVEDSVAQRTGESKAPGVYLDDVDPGPGSVRNKADRKRMLKKVYGDSATKPRKDAEWEPWIELDRIDAECEALVEYDPAQVEQWFLNRKIAQEGAAFDPAQITKQSRGPDNAPVIEPGSTIVIGVDGARYQDAIAAVACDVKTGHIWELAIIERPAHLPWDAEYEHDFAFVDAAVRQAFETYNVWRAYCDPHLIDNLLQGWRNSFGDKRVIDWTTNRHKPIAWAVRHFEQALMGGDITFNKDDELLLSHLRHARKRIVPVRDNNENKMHTLAKPAKDSSEKIDGAMAAVLAYEAAGDCVSHGPMRVDGDTVEDQRENPEPVRERWQPGTAPAASHFQLGEPDDTPYPM